MEEQKGYRIMMNEKQALVVAEALEFYSRFMSGQLDHFPSALQGYMIKTKGVPSSTFDTALQKTLTDLQRILFPDKWFKSFFWCWFRAYTRKIISI